jgi:hypothetical protein
MTCLLCLESLGVGGGIDNRAGRAPQTSAVSGRQVGCFWKEGATGLDAEAQR